MQARRSMRIALVRGVVVRAMRRVQGYFPSPANMPSESIRKMETVKPRKKLLA
jgi:hypothetical protein